MADNQESPASERDFQPPGRYSEKRIGARGGGIYLALFIVLTIAIGSLLVAIGWSATRHQHALQPTEKLPVTTGQNNR